MLAAVAPTCCPTVTSPRSSSFGCGSPNGFDVAAGGTRGDPSADRYPIGKCAPPAGLWLPPGGLFAGDASAVELFGSAGQGGEDWWAGWELAAALFGESGVVAGGAAGGWWGVGVLAGA